MVNIIVNLIDVGGVNFEEIVLNNLWKEFVIFLEVVLCWFGELWFLFFFFDLSLVYFNMVDILIKYFFWFLNVE